MLRFVLLALLVLFITRAFWQLVSGIAQATRGVREGPDRSAAAPVKLMRDPVCGTYVSPRTALSVTAAGRTHYFCSEECRARFRRG